MKYAVVVVFLLMAGCSEDAPVKIGVGQAQYVGVWQYLIEEKTANSLKVKKVMLSIGQDSTAIYRECRVSRSETHSGNSTSSHHTSKTVELPSAVVTQLSDGQIRLQQSMWFMHLKYTLAITSPPSYEEGGWYLGIDGTRLRKLEGDEVSEQTNWECPDDKEKEEA